MKRLDSPQFSEDTWDRESGEMCQSRISTGIGTYKLRVCGSDGHIVAISDEMKDDIELKDVQDFLRDKASQREKSG